MEFNLNRRTFIKAMGGAGLASLFACDSKPIKRVVSHITPQQELVPGVVSWFASVCRECPAGCGIVVATMEGRPIKIEGNPLHPVNKGRLCARGHAALQGLYNPDRVIEPFKRGTAGQRESVSWDSAIDHIGKRLNVLKKNDSLDQVAVVTPHLAGSLSILLDTWSSENPGVNVIEYEPVSYESIEKANEICFDRGFLPQYNFSEVDLVVSFGADFLETWISPVEYASDFALMRSYREGKIGRLFYIGSRQSLTAANADEMVLIRPGTYGALVLGMLRVMLEEKLKPVSSDIDRAALEKLTVRFDPETVYRITDVAEDQLRYLARVIANSRHKILLPGGIESSGTNATENIIAVNILNYFLGNYGDTIEIPDINPYPRRSRSIDYYRLTEKMAKGEISLIVFYDVNPVFTVPPASGFHDAIRQVETVVSCSDTHNETTAVSDYVLPTHSPLESWGDYVPVSGIHGLMQPIVRPRGKSRHFGEILIELSRSAANGASSLSGLGSYYDFLVTAWQELGRTLEPEKTTGEFWENALREGGHFTDRVTSRVKLSNKVFTVAWEKPVIEDSGETGSHPSHDIPVNRWKTDLIVYPSQIHYDGRGANKSWLQELQDPVMQNVWGAYIEVSEQVAERMSLEKGDVLKITSPYGGIECPVYISKRIYMDAVAIPMGQGHSNYGRFANNTGVNPVSLLPNSYDKMSGQEAYLSVQVGLEKSGAKMKVSTPEGHPYDEGRGIVQTINLATLRNLTREEQHKPPHSEHEFKELLEPHDHPKHRWGMVIDLNACNGCGACVVACYSENNISMVGKEQYGKGREMTWIRVERYFSKENPDDVLFIPILCQHCDNAPCEPVCPVYATYHTPEGLNAQIYNRCVGTRYCANNCPYNVRRYNWFTYKFPEPLNQQLNPNVTVRSKGVMEKCTFCVQRIALAKGKAKDENREVRDGEVITACSQTCPTRAITFGDLNDPESSVSKKARSVRGYRILEHVNTKPAITYLKKITGRESIG